MAPTKPPHAGLTRRRLLWSSLGAAASFVVAAACGRRSGRTGRGALPLPDGAPESVFHCIVMGAGIAGVTAARDLQRRGLR
ncbi:MAG: hypothetical protein ACREQ9_15150, partial [Candidatus Binatia bacterium]